MSRVGLVDAEGHAGLGANGMCRRLLQSPMTDNNVPRDKVCVNDGARGESGGATDAPRENVRVDMKGKLNGVAPRHKSAPKMAQTPVVIGMRMKRWTITGRIGAGSFGETFTAIENSWDRESDEERGENGADDSMFVSHTSLNPRGKQEVCIKVEQENKNVLRVEAAALKRMQPCPQVVRYYGSGSTGGLNFLVMQRLGPNLAELRRNTSLGTFSVFTTLKVGISCLKAIRGVHELGLVHRDIKPSNFVIGLGETSDPRTCYIIDFGLARRYRRVNGEIRQPRENAGFRGTSRYASLASHRHQELGRVDDIWSLLFMLIEFVTGTLPWRTCKEKEDIGRCKEETVGTGLVQNLPREFRPFLAHLQTLQYEDEPRYDFLLSLMERALERRNYPPNKHLDWEPDSVDESEVEAEAERKLLQPTNSRDRAKSKARPSRNTTTTTSKGGEIRQAGTSSPMLARARSELPAPLELPVVPAPEASNIGINHPNFAAQLMPPSIHSDEEIPCRVGLSDVNVLDGQFRGGVSDHNDLDLMASPSQQFTAHTALNNARPPIFAGTNTDNRAESGAAAAAAGGGGGGGGLYVNGIGDQEFTSSSEIIDVDAGFSPLEGKDSPLKHKLGCDGHYLAPALSKKKSVVQQQQQQQQYTAGSLEPQSSALPRPLQEEHKQEEDRRSEAAKKRVAFCSDVSIAEEISPSQPKKTTKLEKEKRKFSCECTVI